MKRLLSLFTIMFCLFFSNTSFLTTVTSGNIMFFNNEGENILKKEINTLKIKDGFYDTTSISLALENSFDNSHYKRVPTGFKVYYSTSPGSAVLEVADLNHIPYKEGMTCYVYPSFAKYICHARYLMDYRLSLYRYDKATRDKFNNILQSRVKHQEILVDAGTPYITKGINIGMFNPLEIPDLTDVGFKVQYIDALEYFGKNNPTKPLKDSQFIVNQDFTKPFQYRLLPTILEFEYYVNGSKINPGFGDREVDLMHLHEIDMSGSLSRKPVEKTLDAYLMENKNRINSNLILEKLELSPAITKVDDRYIFDFTKKSDLKAEREVIKVYYKEAIKKHKVNLVNLDNLDEIKPLEVEDGKVVSSSEFDSLKEVGYDLVMVDENGNLSDKYLEPITSSCTLYYKRVPVEISIKFLNERNEVVETLVKKHLSSLEEAEVNRINTSSIKGFLKWEIELPLLLDFNKIGSSLEIKPILKNEFMVSYYLDDLKIGEEVVARGESPKGIELNLDSSYQNIRYSPSLEIVVEEDLRIDILYDKKVYEDVSLTIKVPIGKYYEYIKDVSFKYPYDKEFKIEGIDLSSLNKPYLLFDSHSLDHLIGNKYQEDQVIYEVEERLFKIKFLGKEEVKEERAEYYKELVSPVFKDIIYNKKKYYFKGFSEVIKKVIEDKTYYAVYQSKDGDLIVVDKDDPKRLVPLNPSDVPHLELGHDATLSTEAFPRLEEVKTKKSKDETLIELVFEGSIDDYKVERIVYNNREVLISSQKLIKKNLFSNTKNRIELVVASPYEKSYRVNEFELSDSKVLS